MFWNKNWHFSLPFLFNFNVCIWEKRKLSSLRKFTNFSCIFVRLRKLFYVKSWIGHWAVLRSLWRNYWNVTAVVDWTFAKLDNYFHTSHVERSMCWRDVIENVIVGNDRYIYLIVMFIFSLTIILILSFSRFSVNIVEMILCSNESLLLLA